MECFVHRTGYDPIGALTNERPYSPTKLDKIKNLHVEVRSGSVVGPWSRPVEGIDAPCCNVSLFGIW